MDTIYYIAYLMYIILGIISVIYLMIIVSNADTTIRLEKESWHYKIINYMFNEEKIPDQFFPYFWLSCLCIIIYPFIKLFKFITSKN